MEQYKSWFASMCACKPTGLCVRACVRACVCVCVCLYEKVRLCIYYAYKCAYLLDLHAHI